MADIKVRIEVNPNQETEFLGSIQNQVGTSGSVENLSNVSVQTDSLAVFQNIPNLQNAISGINGLSLGQDLVFDENGYLDNQDLQGAVIEDEQNPDEFVWGVVPESGEYHVKLTFINAQNLKDIIVKGDDVVGQFPTQAIVDGQTTIYSDDSNWAINLQTESTTHTIEFTHWNRTGYNACLTLIAVMLRYFEIDKYNGLKSVESLSQSTGQPKEIFYGVVPSSGSLEVIDVNGEIADMVNDGVMPNSNVNIDVFANGKQVHKHISESSSYTTSIGSRSLNIDLGNMLSVWENTNYSGYQLNNETSLYNVLVEVLSANYTQNEIDEMLNDIMYNNENQLVSIKQYLQSIIIKYPYISNCSLKEAIDKICVLGQLNVFENGEGKIRFISSRPLITNNDNFISIPVKAQLSILNQDLFLNNKYNSVNVQYNSPILEDYSLHQVKYKYYDYEQISADINNYTKIINDPTKNPGLTILYDELGTQYNRETPNNTEENEAWNNWYYYIAKLDVPYDISDMTILRDFNPKIGHYRFDIFPTNEIQQTDTEDESYTTITPYNYEYTDEEIISDWVQYNSEKQEYEVVSGGPNLQFKARKNQDGTFTLFYMSLFKILTYYYSILPQTVIFVQALYNELNINFLCPRLSIGSNIDDVQNADVSISNNELLQDNVNIDGNSLINIMTNNILSDYTNGIHYGEISVICGDYYDINENKVKDWSKGDIFNIGDSIIIETNSNYRFRITGNNFRNNGVPIQDLQIQEIKLLYNSKSFAEDDWSLIETISKTGTAELYYNIGDEKTITLTTGEQVTLQILDFNRDVADNGNVVGITLGTKNLLNTKYPMNTTDTNAGGWQTSAMRTSTMQTIYNQLPSDLRTRVKQVKKQTYNRTSGIVETYDYVWLLSQIELSGRLLGTYEGEGMQYRYWQEHNTDNDRRKLTTSGAESAYWLRSPYTGDNFEFKIVSGSGQVSQFLNAEASWANGGVAFCLCV